MEASGAGNIWDQSGRAMRKPPINRSNKALMYSPSARWTRKTAVVGLCTHSGNSSCAIAFSPNDATTSAISAYSSAPGTGGTGSNDPHKRFDSR